jgi:hypothetical protein
MSGPLLIAISLLVGWVSLAGVRDLLGVWGFRLAVPVVGLAGWSVVAVLTTVLDARWTWPIVAAGLLAYALGFLAVTLTLRTGPPDRRALGDLWGDAAVFGILLVFSTVVARAGISLVSKDSWAGYALFGISLRETGRLTPEIFAFRGAFVPALHAAEMVMGSDWAYVVYPVMGALVASLVAYAAARTAFHDMEPSRRALASAAIAVLMVATAPFVLHSIYIHANMASALYLLFGLVAFERASAATIRWDEHGRSSAIVWCFLAGAAAATFSLIRPDGLAYAFVLHGIAAVLLAGGRIRRRDAIAYFGTFLIWTAAAVAVVVPGWSEAGISRETGAATSLSQFSEWTLWAILAVTAVFAVVVVAAASIRAVAARPWIVPAILSAGSLLALAAAWVANPEGFAQMGWVVGRNLTATGGYNLLWYWALGVVAVAILLWPDGRDRVWLRLLVFAAFLFFSIALVVHGLTHPGRTGWSDSMNRLVFHIVPVLFWLFALEFGIAADGIRGALRRLGGIGYPREAVEEE